MNKIILHCHDTDNLIFLAQAANNAIKADMAEGDWKVWSFGEGQINPPIIISAIKRKSCVTVYDQPARAALGGEHGK